MHCRLIYKLPQYRIFSRRQLLRLHHHRGLDGGRRLWCCRLDGGPVLCLYRLGIGSYDKLITNCLCQVYEPLNFHFNEPNTYTKTLNTIYIHILMAPLMAWPSYDGPG